MCNKFVKLGTKTWKTTLKRRVMVDARDIVRSVAALSERARVDAVLDVTDDPVPNLPPCASGAFVAASRVAGALEARMRAASPCVAVFIPLAGPRDPRSPFVAYFRGDRIATVVLERRRLRPRARVAFDANGEAGACGYAGYVLVKTR
jgi:hypothetical protein